MENLSNNELVDNIISFIKNIDKKFNIEFAYLFGSTARKQDRKDSDIDIGIKFKNKYSNTEDVLIRGEIIDIGKAYFKKDVDIVSLDRASLILKYEIVKDGIIIKDSINRASFESLVLREYFDFKYYSDIYNNIVIENMKKGNFFKGE